MAATSRQNALKDDWDRRSGRRYQFDAEVEYRLVRRRGIVEMGRGRTVNVSSTGVLFDAGRPIAPGVRIELSIPWPAQLDSVVRLQLHVNGRTVRTRENRIAVRILSYEFRVRGRLEGAETMGNG